MKRKTSRKVAELRLFKKRAGKHVSPHIAKTIEEFVKDNHVDVDTWCRTGVLTFDGN